MNMKFLIFFYLIVFVFTLLPIWDLKNSSIDLLNTGDCSHEYTILNTRMYDLTTTLKKKITRNNGKITQVNTIKIIEHISDTETSEIIPETNVEFENIESFYKLNGLKVLCPQRNFNLVDINNNLNTIEFSDWTKDDYWDLKCYYHRMGYFLVYYLINGNNEIQAFKESNQTWLKYDSIQIYDEMYDFKLINKEYGSSYNGPFSFMALIKDNNYIKLFSSKYKFNGGISLDTNTTKELIESKMHTKGYFNSDSNNNFYYFTYNNILDFSSGYSTNPPGSDYSIIDSVTIQNNDRNPFEFLDEVEIREINFVANNKYAYYSIYN